MRLRLLCVAAAVLTAACEDPAPSITWEQLCAADPTLEQCSPAPIVRIVDVASNYRFRDPAILVGDGYVERSPGSIRTPSSTNTCRMSFVLDLMDEQSKAACEDACGQDDQYACDILREIR